MSKATGIFGRGRVQSALAAALAVLLSISFPAHDSRADCQTNTVVSPDTIICTNADTNGVSLTSFDAAGVAVTMNPGSSLSNGGTAMNINQLGGPNLTFSMSDPFSFISSGTGTGLNVNVVLGGGTQTYNVAGSILATQDVGVNLNYLLGGTSTFNLQDTGLIRAGDTGILMTSVAGTSNFTVNNAGQIYAGDDGISMIALAGFGTFTVTNSGSIGSQALPIGDAGVSMVGVGYSGTVSNTNTGSIYSTGDSVFMLVGGTATVTNAGSITSTGGIGVSLNAGGNTSVDNTNGTISGFDGGVNTFSLTGTGFADNTGGSISTTDGIGLAVVAAGQVDIEGDAASSVTSTNGPGIVGISTAAASDVTIDSGTVSAGSDTVLTAIPVLPFVFPTSGGVNAIALGAGSNATINAHGNISVNGGLIGAGALSASGAATVNLDDGIVIDPPLIGAGSVVLGGNSNATVNVGTGTTVEATAIGILALNLGTGDAVVNGPAAIVNQDPNPAGVGVLSLALGGGDSQIDIGTVTAAGSGVVGLGANSDVTTRGDVTAGGAFGVAGTAAAGTSNVTILGNVAQPAVGGFSLALGGDSNLTVANGVIVDATTIGLVSTALGGNSNVNAGDSNGVSTVNSTGTGIVSTAAGGSSTVNSGEVSAADSGVISTAVGGDSTISTYGKIDAGGTFGAISTSLGGTATVNVNAPIDPPIVGALAVAFGPGDATVSVNAGAPVEAFVLGAGAVQIGTGDANVTTNDTIRADVFGVGTLKIGDGNSNIAVNEAVAGLTGDRTFNAIQAVAIGNNGEINVTTGGGLDPFIGTDGGTLLADNDAINILKLGGGGDINVELNADATAGDDVIDIFRTLSGGTASAINIEVGATSVANLLSENSDGILIVTPFALNDINVAVHEGSSIVADSGSAISISSFSLLGDNAVDIDNAGLLQGNGFPFLAPTIGVLTDGALTITNQESGVITTASGLPYAYIVNAAAGADMLLNNLGYMNGAMLLGSLGNITLNNDFGSGGIWDTSGLNTFAAGGDIIVNNNSGAVINSLGLSTFAFIDGGDSTINNFGTINVTYFDDPLLGDRVPGFTSFLGIEAFNNAGGLLDMRNGISHYDVPPLDQLAAPYGSGVGDVTVMSNVSQTTQFNGAGGKLGIDAFLRGPGSDSSSDLLLIGGSVNGTTKVLVNDTNAGPGAYNPTGILFAHADGANPGTFKLADGPIDKGFFEYDIFKLGSKLDPQLVDANDWVLASYPNARAFELPKLITGAQTIWYESSGVWLDRTADLRRQLDCAIKAPASVASLKVGPAEESAAPGPCVQQRFGLWARGIGGDFSRDKTSHTTLFGVTKTFNGDYDQDLWGIEGGADIVLTRPGSGYGALFAGILGGFVQSDMDFKGTGDRADYDGGMVGGYLTYLAGNWYNDLLFKADLLSVDYTTTFQGGKASPEIDSFGIRYDTGYRFNAGNGFFVDPQATIAWVDTDADSFTLFDAPVRFDNGESIRGRLGGRIGYSTRWGNTIVEPFFAGSFWHEFEGDNKATLTSGSYKLSFKDQLDDSWGELGGGLNVFTGSASSLFIKADALVSGELEGFNVKGGGRLAW